MWDRGLAKDSASFSYGKRSCLGNLDGYLACGGSRLDSKARVLMPGIPVLIINLSNCFFAYVTLQSALNPTHVTESVFWLLMHLTEKGSVLFTSI